ncbi:hypothetical protein [uncultured Lactobacillus sp.]|uniref:hypothetical protein n=1 Tax=uncultured Lactobacillus sp. TaxID=153152 RepID=UPI002617358C|nr:hypothetical protein [uncultured Lactobacillus sp.]
MKVIDKRTIKSEETYNVGDVINYYDDEGEKFYGMIIESTKENKYYIAFLDDDEPGKLSINGLYDNETNCSASSVDDLITALTNNWDHVEKVNAHLVVED